MKSKTLEHITKKRVHALKEIHFIDTSVLIGAVKSVLDNRATPEFRYLGRLKSGRYLAIITPVVYGETFFILWRDAEKGREWEVLRVLSELIDDDNICPFFPRGVSAYISCLEKVSGVERRCGMTDARIAAEGIAAKEFMSADSAFEKCRFFLISADRGQSTEYLEVKLAEDVE